MLTRFGCILAWVLTGCFAEAPTNDGDTTSATAGDACPMVEEPEGSDACPAICNGGCVENECQILCTGAEPCTGLELACPPDFACDFDCEGDNACESAVFTCPSDFACALSCNGDGACATAELQCGFSECSVECGPDGTPCAGTLVQCSGAACLAECASDVAPTLVGCQDACSCVEC